MSSEPNHLADAERQAWDFIWEHEDDVRDDLIEGVAGTEPDDYDRDWMRGDQYGGTPGLTEAAVMLDQLSDHEETDEGLWEGLPPREAIAAQAAWTYGNAVAHFVKANLEQVNSFFDSVTGGEWADFPDGWRKHYVPLAWPYIANAYTGGVHNWDTDAEKAAWDPIRSAFEQEDHEEFLMLVGRLLDYQELDAGRSQDPKVAELRTLYNTWLLFVEKQKERRQWDEAVAGPGKFEGQPAWVAYYYDRGLNGCGTDQDSDDDGSGWEAIDVTDEDKLMFPELADRDEVVIGWSEQGFVFETDRPKAGK